jgi:hypothetical protein
MEAGWLCAIASPYCELNCENYSGIDPVSGRTLKPVPTLAAKISSQP